MSDAFRSPHPELDRVVAFGTSHVRSLVVGLSLAFFLGLVSLPYLNALDNAGGFLAGFAQWMIAMSLIIPPVVLVFVGVNAGRSFVSSRYDKLLADAEDPHNVAARRTVRVLRLLASGGPPAPPPRDVSEFSAYFEESADSSSSTADELEERIEELETAVSDAKETANVASLFALVALAVSVYVWWKFT